MIYKRATERTPYDHMKSTVYFIHIVKQAVDANYGPTEWNDVH